MQTAFGACDGSKNFKFFPSLVRFLFYSDRIDSIEWQDPAPRQRAGDCLWIHIPRWGLCDPPLSSHQTVLLEVVLRQCVLCKDPLLFSFSSRLRNFGLSESEYTYCGSVILLPHVQEMTSLFSENCVRVQAILPPDFLWTPSTSQQYLTTDRPNFSCHFFLVLGFWCVPASSFCSRWDSCWSATLPWEHRIGFWGSRIIGLVYKSETVGKIGEADEVGERELLRVVSVRCGKERDMTRGWQLFWWHKDVQSWALQLLSHACSREKKVFLQATETCPNSEKKSPIVRAWRMLRIPIARLLPMGLVPRWQRWRSCLQVGPRSWRSCLQVSESPTCFWINRVVIFFVALKIVVLFAVLFVDCEECLCSSWVLAKCSTCNRLHSLFAWAKWSRWLSDCWVPPPAFIVRIQCFEFWILSALFAV